jgi:hypothetical protein
MAVRLVRSGLHRRIRCRVVDLAGGDVMTRETVGEILDQLDKEPEPMTGTPSALSAAKVEVMKKVKRLEKLHANKHGGYQFASIDDFKDEIRPIMAEHGIDLHVSEESYELVGVKNKDGKETSSAKIRFRFVLQHLSGERGEPSFVTVVMPYTGAQTSGAAMSYAIKECVYKGQFQASSGDLNEEADLQEQVQLAAVERLTKQEARPLYEALQKEMLSIEAETRDSNELASWWSRSLEQLNMLPIDWKASIKKECGEIGLRLKASEALDGKQ